MTTPVYSILIVDDDKFLLDMYALKFKERGFKVDTAPNGADALTKLSSGTIPDIIMLDVVMPGMDGLELLSEIRSKKLAEKCVTIILSNLGQKEDIDKGLALGIDGYIIKASCTPTEVTNKVNEILSRKKS